MRFLDFRNHLDAVRDPFESYVLKLSYLTGARANELAGEGTIEGKEGKKGGITKPLCPTKGDVDYDNFEGNEVIKFKLHVEKRKESNGEKPLRTVAVPLSLEYEPWAIEVSQFIEKLEMGQPLVALNRQALNILLRRNGAYAMALGLPENEKFNSLCNPLRHLRIHFLMDYYHMNPIEVVNLVGWKLSASLAGGISSELSRYAHLQWTQYFPKLLKAVPVPL